MLLLDINDTEITLLQDGETLYREPGVAFVSRRDVVFGNEALAQARLHPRQSHNEFWQRLNADPVTPGGRGIANQADLVYRHLQAVRRAIRQPKRAPIVVAAPSATTPQQLAVLLGIAAEAGFEVQAIVDAAVAATCLHPIATTCRVIDITLHRSVVTHLQVANGQVRRGTVDEVPAAGYAALTEGWVDAVADRFVENSRFDPLRIAATEQQVFEQVAAGIKSDQAEFAIHLRHDDITRQVDVTRRTFAEKSEQRYALLARSIAPTMIGAPTMLAITERVRQLPGLAAYLQAAGHDILTLPGNAVAAAVAAHAERIVPAEAASGAQLIASLPLHEGRRGHARRSTAQPLAVRVNRPALAHADPSPRASGLPRRHADVPHPLRRTRCHDSAGRRCLGTLERCPHRL